jgi:hypothetical protein
VTARRRSSQTTFKVPPSPEQAAFAGQIQGVIGQSQVIRQTLSSGSATPVGSYASGDIDVLDLSNLSAIPTEPDSAVGSIAHELAEQNAKQAALARGQLRDAQFDRTHPIGVKAQAQQLVGKRSAQSFTKRRIDAVPSKGR